jgi:hypothetical protein
MKNLTFNLNGNSTRPEARIKAVLSPEVISRINEVQESANFARSIFINTNQLMFVNETPLTPAIKENHSQNSTQPKAPETPVYEELKIIAEPEAIEITETPDVLPADNIITDGLSIKELSVIAQNLASGQVISVGDETL